jgi:hypothetical protein
MVDKLHGLTVLIIKSLANASLIQGVSKLAPGKP